MNPVLAIRGMVNSMHTLYAVDLGMQLGLFQALADSEPIGRADFVAGLPCEGEYADPWLRVVQSAGIVEVDGSDRVSFAMGWKEALTDQRSDIYVGHMPRFHLRIAGAYKRFPRLFRSGGHMPRELFNRRLIAAMAADSQRFANLFCKNTVDDIPHLRAKLEEGCLVCDVGCGGGKLAVKLGEAFPSSTIVGIDKNPAAVGIARREAIRMGLQTRVRFQRMCATGLPKNVADLVLLVEVLHEIEPGRRPSALRAMRRALKPDGVLFIADGLATHGHTDFSSEMARSVATTAFFEAPWGSKFLTRSELVRLLDEAGFGDLHASSSSEDFIEAYAT